MGAASSSLNELGNNKYLLRLTSKEAISSNDPFWNQLLSYAFVPPISSTDAKLLEEQTAQLLKTFAVNNLSTGNLRSLLRVFITMATNLQQFVLQPMEAEAGQENDIFLMQLYNALFIARSLIKNLIENTSEELLLEQIEFDPAAASPEADAESELTTIEEFIESVVVLIVQLPVRDSTYPLVYECTCTLISLLSVQLYRREPADELAFFQILFAGRCSMHAYQLTAALLGHFWQRRPAPDRLLASTVANTGIYNAAASLATGLWSLVTLGYGGSSGTHSAGRQQLKETLLARQSCLLILLLTVNCTGSKHFSNAHREALFACADANGMGDAEASATEELVAFRCDFKQLLSAICSQLPSDDSLLLLYLLLHPAASGRFRRFLDSHATDEQLSQLLLPILQNLYSQPKRISHRMYMSLIVLLILSECKKLSKRLHWAPAPPTPWLTERHLTDISIGSLLVIVLARTVQLNAARLSDKYLHTNCLAALANASAHLHSLHPYASSKLIGLASILCKRYAKLIARIHQQQQQLEADKAALEDLLRCVLEIINSALSNCLADNPHLVYALLHQRAAFDCVQTHPAFQGILQNISTVVQHFACTLDKVAAGTQQQQQRQQQQQQQLSEQLVLEIIAERSAAFRSDRLKPFPEAKYSYVEDESPEDFFVPYVWALVHSGSGLYFSANRAQLLRPHCAAVQLQGDTDAEEDEEAEQQSL